MRETIVKCDICQSEKVIDNFKIQVLFTTEQTEGRGITPYNLSDEKLDLCESCRSHVLKGNYIFAEGAMGYNKYYFRKGKNNA